MKAQAKVPTPGKFQNAALLVIENAPLREEALQALRAAHRQLDQLQAQWTDYQAKDQPAYQSWIQITFSDLIQQIQKISHEVLEKRSLVESVMREAAEKGLTFAEAYENVVNDTAGEAIREPEPEPELERDSPPEDDTEGFGYAEDSEGAAETPHPLPDEQESRLKSIYRQLAQRLHPDVAGSDGSEVSRLAALWLETQDAYDSRNLHKLEAIWELLNQGMQGRKLPSQSLSELRARFEQVLRAIQALRRDIRGATRNPAWGFSRPDRRRPSKVRRVFRKVKTELETELEEVSEALVALQRFIDHWLNPEIASEERVRYRNRHGHRQRF